MIGSAMYPSTYTVELLARVAGPADAHGAATWTYAAPELVPVYGWSPPSADGQPFEPGRAAVVRDLDLLADSFPGLPGDHVAVAGVLYEQVGHPADFNHGPFGFTPGVRVSLQRVEEAG